MGVPKGVRGPPQPVGEETAAALVAEAEVVPDVAPVAGQTLSDRAKAARKTKAALTPLERAERNQQHAKQLAEKNLFAAFGPARDGSKSKRVRSLLPEEMWEDPLEVAPTRRKISKTEQNLALIAQQKKRNPLLQTLQQ